MRASKVAGLSGLFLPIRSSFKLYTTVVQHVYLACRLNSICLSYPRKDLICLIWLEFSLVILKWPDSWEKDVEDRKRFHKTEETKEMKTHDAYQKQHVKRPSLLVKTTFHCYCCGQFWHSKVCLLTLNLHCAVIFKIVGLPKNREVIFFSRLCSMNLNYMEQTPYSTNQWYLCFCYMFWPSLRLYMYNCMWWNRQNK